MKGHGNKYTASTKSGSGTGGMPKAMPSDRAHGANTSVRGGKRGATSLKLVPSIKTY